MTREAWIELNDKYLRNNKDRSMAGEISKIELNLEELSRTELDFHVNMAAVGKCTCVLNDTGLTADVRTYTPDYESIMISIVDAAMQYECPYTGTIHILIIRNALHVISMENNLIPPFIIREAGIELNDTPKIQIDDPDVEYHSVYFKETKFRIPLSLWGTFSNFSSTKTIVEFLNECEKIHVLRPTVWNPHSSPYAKMRKVCFTGKDKF